MSSAPLSFEQQLLQWIAADDQIKTVQAHLKNLRERKQQLATQLIHLQSSTQRPSIVKMKHGYLKFAQTKETQPLTFSFLEQCLHELIDDKSQVQEIIDFVKEHRDTKVITEIKRFSSSSNNA